MDIMGTVFILSLVTGLLTEGAKATLDEMGVPHKDNLLAGGMAVAGSLLTCVCQILIGELHICGETAAYAIALAVLTWLSAMVGYDKVKQTLTQGFKGGKE